MKTALLAAAAVLGASVHAQSSAGSLIRSGIDELRDRKLIKVVQTKATEPSAHPGLPAKEQVLPRPEPPADSQREVRILEAGEIQQTGDEFRALGGVRIQYRGYDIVAERVEGNLRTEVFEATGNVRVTGKEAVISGERVQVDFARERFRAWQTQAQLEGSLLRGVFLDPLYVKSVESSGTQREVIALHSSSTTCSYAQPHYHVDARHTTVRPGTRAIFRKLRLVLLGRTVLRLPYLSVPLTDPNYRYLPEVGSNEQDGYFVKSRYGVPLGGENNFDARLDYFQKRGTGFGGDYRYVGRALNGVLTLYALAGVTRTLNLNSEHEQRLPFGVLSLQSSYLRNDFLNTPSGSEQLTARAQLNVPQGADNTRFSIYRTETSTGSFDSRQQTIAINDARRFGRTTRSLLDVSWVDSVSGAIGREQVDVKFLGEHDLRRAMARFEYQRSIPVGDNSSFFSGSDRTPVVTLLSDARRLFGSKAPANLPFTTELSAGEYVDARTRDHVTRSAFNFAFQRPDQSKNRTRLQLNGRFRQGVYSDDTAQYVLAFGGHLSHRLGPDTGLNLRYNYLRPYGFSPLAIDQTGKTNLLSVDLSNRPIRPLLVGVQSGYDLEVLRLGTRSPWQFVGVRMEYEPTSWLLFRTLSSYDTNRQAWSNIRLDMTYRPGATLVTVGALYDGIRQTWGNANLFIDGLKWGRLKMSTVLQYNGYLQKLQAQHYSLTYDMHCAEAVLQVIENQTGFRTGRQISFFFRLKAIPYLSPFGVGGLGQPLGTGTGRKF